jgi:formate C-acetyltransferase
MIHGLSNVGSIDAGVNLPLVLEETLKEYLAVAGSFEDLLQRFEDDVSRTVREIVENVNLDQRTKAACRPHPMRSLLIDDCIDCGVDYNAGGARYNWSVVNVAGLADVADSLVALREVVFERKEKTGAALLSILEKDFDGEEAFRRRLARCPHFGNDDPIADDVARQVAKFVFEEFRRYRPWRGGRFLPSCIVFVTYVPEGARVGATPDGRHAGQPLSDSIGPARGRDRHGPTAMLNSVTKLPLHLATGTPILNVRFSRKIFADKRGRRRIRELVQAYFDQGGMQIQINVVDQAALRDAIAHPERHEDLIVRVGGYSAYFNSLTPEMKMTFLERTEHGGA